MDQISGYSKRGLDKIKMICYDRKVYVLQTLIISVLDWYHSYLNHPGGSIIAKEIMWVYYWKGIFTQAELYVNQCKICQQLKNIKTLYRSLPSKNTAELKPWDLVHVYLISPYSKSIRQYQPGGDIIKINVSLTCIFEIVKVPTYDLGEVTGINDEYVDKSSSRVSQLFNNTWLSIYPCSRKVVFDNGSEFK